MAINVVLHFNTELQVSYACLPTFSNVTVVAFGKIYIINVRDLEPGLRKMICSSKLTCLDIMKSNS